MKQFICIECGEIIKKKKCYKFCCKKCRTRHTNKKRKEEIREGQLKKRAKFAPNKKKCKICGGGYVQVGSHIYQKHGITAREYRAEFGLPLKRGIVTKEFRAFKGRQAIENGTVSNLKKGKKNGFKKNDPRTKKEVGWKSHRYTPDEYYE